ncbi:hypothetical protein [Bradyrhizobium sp. 142]|uniref:hypothetical protein n=1 Tax=Bradyrhizobium sp. 142 TaxID=2782618 RepID=UPI001FF85047|nr:hypothetical protein [Bradyrhizobium sp. 142]MCK1724666.1 hypothetical protein [Bradyrhizobium sp. 142]
MTEDLAVALPAERLLIVEADRLMDPGPPPVQLNPNTRFTQEKRVSLLLAIAKQHWEDDRSTLRGSYVGSTRLIAISYWRGRDILNPFSVTEKQLKSSDF